MCGYDLRDDLDPVTTANGTYSTHLFADRVVDIINDHEEDKVSLLAQYFVLFLYSAYTGVVS